MGLPTKRKHKLHHEPVLSVHCSATLDLGASVEQPNDCLIQNRQAVQFTGRSMDWTLEENIVNGLIFCVTHNSQKQPYHICANRIGNVQRRCGGGLSHLLFSLDELIPLDGQLSAEWSRCPGSMARRAKDSVTPSSGHRLSWGGMRYRFAMNPMLHRTILHKSITFAYVH